MKIKEGDKLPDSRVFIFDKDLKEVSIKQIISNITAEATIDVIWFGLSLVGIKQATSPPIISRPINSPMSDE